MAVRYAKDNADYLKKLIKKYTVRSWRWIVVWLTETEGTGKQTAEGRIASLVGNGLNITVEVK